MDLLFLKLCGKISDFYYFIQTVLYLSITGISYQTVTYFCWPKGTITLCFNDSKTHVVCGTNYLKSVFSTHIFQE